MRNATIHPRTVTVSASVAAYLRATASLWLALRVSGCTAKQASYHIVSAMA